MVPPQLIAALPESGSLNFNSKQIVLSFDEYIQLNDIQSELIISPPLRNKPQIQLRKKSILITLNEDLLPNTTYTFNFGDGIVDLNEGNIFTYQYIFSTGSVLDSMMFKGKVRDALSAQPVQGVKVMLYEQDDDSIPMKERPLYFGRTAKDGTFGLTNLKPGNFKVFAIEESNGNYLYDSEDERIAFTKSLVASHASDSTGNDITLILASEYHPTKFIDSQRSDSTGVMVIKPNRAWGSVKVTSLDGLPLIYAKDESGDSLRVYLDNNLNPGDYKLVVSNDDKVLDTLETRVFDNLSKTLDLRCPASGKFNAKDGIVLYTDPRVKQLNSQSLRLLRDSLELPYSLQSKSQPGFWSVIADYQEGANYELTIFPGLANYAYKTNDSITCKVGSFGADFFGTLNVKLDSDFDGEGKFLLQFMTEKGKLIQEIYLSTGKEQLNFSKLEPGNYQLRILNDGNRDGKWTAPNYLQGIEPEEFMYYQNTISIRSNWEMDIVWELRF